MERELAAAPAAALSSAHASARGALNCALLTDAPLLHPPGALAAAALRVGLRAAGLPTDGLVAHIAGRAKAWRCAEVEGGDPREQDVDEEQELRSRLVAELDAIDALADASAALSGEALQTRATEVDRMVKLWRQSRKCA